MRQDIKNLIDNRPIWQEMNTVDTVVVEDVLPVQVAIKKWRKQDPVGADLVAAYIIAKGENDNLTAETVWKMMKQHQGSKDAR